MPTLNQYVDGSGFYIKDYLPPNHLTYQVGPPGLGWLRRRGISAHRDLIKRSELDHLRENGLVTVKGEGGRGDSGGASPLADVTALADALRVWAVTGDLPGLTRVVYGGRLGDRRAACFSGVFLDWLGHLDPDLDLPHFAELSLAGFEDVARRLRPLWDDPLHGYLAELGAVEVLWRLARVVGLVAGQAHVGGAECPPAWQSHPLLSRAFALVSRLPPRSGERRPPDPTRANLRLPPSVVWEVDGQRVVVVLPAQSLPAGVCGVRWAVGDEPAVDLFVRDGAIDEVVTGPVRAPAGWPVRVTAELRLDTGDEPQTREWRPSVPADGPCVLFHPGGGLVDTGEGDPVPAGDYLALVPRAGEDAFFARRGVARGVRVPVAPAGWPGWRGWHVALAPGADLGPYQVVRPGGACTWGLESPRPGPPWCDARPVWVGRWPRVYVDPAENFRGAVLRVVVDQPGHPAAGPATLVIGEAVPLETDPETGRAYLDLDRCGPLAARFGTVRLSCQAPAAAEQPPLAAHFTRLPPLGVEFIDDPREPDRSQAVRVAAPYSLTGARAGEDTELIPEPGQADRLVLRPSDAARAPAVGAVVPDGCGGRVAVRVRVRATRVALVTPAGGLGEWYPLPLSTAGLGVVRVDDRLLVEFHRPPYLVGDKLAFRLPGREPLLAGREIGDPNRTAQFEVELHRWRDHFGRRAQGTVQVRTAGRWLDLAELPTTEAGPPLPPPPPPPEWARILADLHAAVVGDDPARVRHLAGQALARSRATGTPDVAAEALALGAARGLLAVAAGATDLDAALAALAPLADRPDLPDAALWRHMLAIRREHHSAPSAWSESRVETLRESADAWPCGDALLAECWYNFARASAGPADAALRSCHALAGEFLDRPDAADHPDRAGEAHLLRAVAGLLLHTPGAGEAPADGVLRAYRPWLRAVALAAELTRRAWRGPDSGAAVDLTGPPPAVLRPDDAALLRFVAAQAAGSPEAERHWATVAGWTADRFGGIDLFRARRARLAGDRRAQELYAALLRLAGERGWRWLQEVAYSELTYT